MSPTTSSPTRDYAAHDHDHTVSFYRDDGELTDSVTAFLSDSLTAGGSAVVIARPGHRAMFDDALRQLGHSIDDLRESGRYITLDAARTLDKFTLDGVLDAPLFDTIVGSVLDAAATHGGPVRAFGEMVALLWDAGNVGAAVELESMWNDLATRHDFSLMCAYAQAGLRDSSLDDATEVCRLHSRVELIGDATPAAGRDDNDAFGPVSEVFVPVPASVRAARLFITAALADSVVADVIDDAALVVAELASNAITHAGSAFRVSATWSGPRLRIAVEDTDGVLPQLRRIDRKAPNGRGLAMAAHLADEWGCDTTPTGKSVWVEFGERLRVVGPVPADRNDSSS